MARSRIIELRDPAALGRARDDRTMVIGQRGVRVGPEVSAEVAFITHYRTIRKLCRRVRDPALAVFAIDMDGLAGSLILGARPDRVAAAVLGRHRHVDLWLGEDPALSLRHLAILTHRHPKERPLRYRVLDLRTEVGFASESGERLDAFEASGPVFTEVGAYVVLFLPLDGRLAWPTDPLEAWAGLPERVYTGAPRSASRARPARLAARPAGPDVTAVQRLPGPRRLAHGLRAGEAPLGELTVTSKHGQLTVAVGPAAARAGVLLGRYARCDNAGLAVLETNGVSRVHLLVLDVDGALYAIDTGSTNGVHIGGSAVRSHPLAFGDEVELGHKLGVVRWSAVH